MADEEFPLYPTAIFLPIAACVVIILDVPPLIWHIRNRNLAAGSLVVWLIIDNFIAFINSLIWPRDNLDQAFTGHGLCDLESYITVAKWTGLCTSVLGITRNLAKVLDTKRQVIRRSRAQQVRELAIDSVICWVPPILQLAVFDVVREYRYYIYGINGCLPSLDGSWLSLVLVFLWPIIASLALAYYAILVLNRLHRYRSDFSRLIQSHSTTRSRFLRLFLLSSLLLLGILPTQSILVWANFPTRPDSYSWSHNHDPGVRGQQIGVKSYGYLIPDRWVSLACGLLVFLFFGLGTDASAMYRSWLSTLNPLRFSPARRHSSNSGLDLPINHQNHHHHHHHHHHKHWPCSSSSSSSASSAMSNTNPSSPSRSLFSCKTCHTSSLTTTTTTTTTPTVPLNSKLLFSKSLRKPSSASSLQTLWRDTIEDKSIAHNEESTRTLSTAAPTIETAISMTPLSHSIGKASVGTLVEDNDHDDALMVLGGPAEWEKEGERSASRPGLGIEGICV